VLALLVLSHWLLDALVYRPDLPLTPFGEVRVGLGAYFTPSRTPISWDRGQRFTTRRTPFHSDRGQRFSVMADSGNTRG